MNSKTTSFGFQLTKLQSCRRYIANLIVGTLQLEPTQKQQTPRQLQLPPKSPFLDLRTKCRVPYPNPSLSQKQKSHSKMTHCGRRATC